ncbi:MAG: tetratricopeptide repeat protein, partial [Alphaproteobacteria bacterium]|nr:tetratricopeptide repeat protein [Alphaproteobacteria bacterium]
LRRAAESDPDPWLFAYVDALIKLGRKEELATFLGGRALDARQTPEIRRQLAFQLLELDRRDLAEPAFRALAASAAPDSNDVGQLLYLWGPRPTAAQIDWIEARAQGASGEARLAWLRKLLDVNAYARVIAFYERQPDDAGRPAYIEALVRLRDGRRLAAAIEGRIAAGAGVEELRQLARLGEQESQLRPALGALQALLAKQPDDAPALAQAGRIAFYLNRRNEARDALARLLARAPGDYQSNFIYAEVLAAEKRIAAARPHFQRALELVRAEPVQTYPMRLTEAQTLQRLGRREEALAAFKDLVEERPRDASLRADYVAALLDAGRTAEARQMLTGQ